MIRFWPSDHQSYGTPPLPFIPGHPRLAWVCAILSPTGVSIWRFLRLLQSCYRHKSLAIKVSYFSASPIANQLRIRTSPRLTFGLFIFAGHAFALSDVSILPSQLRDLPVPQSPFRPVDHPASCSPILTGFADSGPSRAPNWVYRGQCLHCIFLHTQGFVFSF